jgi:hypothetical protein
MLSGVPSFVVRITPVLPRFSQTMDEPIPISFDAVQIASSSAFDWRIFSVAAIPFCLSQSPGRVAVILIPAALSTTEWKPFSLALE